MAVVWAQTQESASEGSTPSGATVVGTLPAVSTGTSSRPHVVFAYLMTSGAGTWNALAGWTFYQATNSSTGAAIGVYIDTTGGVGTSTTFTFSNASANIHCWMEECDPGTTGVNLAVNATGTGVAGAVPSCPVTLGTAAGAGDLGAGCWTEHFAASTAITWNTPSNQAGWVTNRADTAAAGNHLYCCHNLSLPSGTLTVTGSSGTPSTVTAGWAGVFLTVTASAVTGTGGLVGAYLNPAKYGAGTTMAQAINAWQSNCGRPLTTRREYWGPSSFPAAITSTEKADADSGRKLCISFKPDPAGTTADQQALDNALSSMKAYGLAADVALWHEPYYGGLTATQYQTMTRYYAATVRQYYPLVAVTSAGSVRLNGENSYLSGLGAYFDKYATDFYCSYFVTYGNPMGTGNSVTDPAYYADLNGKPFGLWEFNGSLDATQGQAKAQITSYFQSIQSYFSNRLTAGKNNCDILLFSSDTNLSQETPIITADGGTSSYSTTAEFRNALFGALFDALNANTSTSASLVATQSLTLTGTASLTPAAALAATQALTLTGAAVLTAAAPGLLRATQALQLTGQASLALTSPPGPSLFPLGVRVELLINGSWEDITSFVYQRDDITITGGRTSEGDKAQHARATFTVSNRDGRFTPTYSGGAYYPYLQRNVQCRISVAAASAAGNYYSGYRFWGEVAHWPPRRDLSGKDVYVPVHAAGPLRRIRAGGGKGSALTRYYNQLTGSYSPVAYWPCEEDPDATQLQAGIEGGQDMTVTGTPLFKAVSDFNGSAPIAVVSKSTWDGQTGSFGGSGDDVFSVAGTYTWSAPVATATVRCWGGGGGGAGGGPADGQNGGGGGEFAQETTLALTPGSDYTVVVGKGGSGGGQGNSTGSDGKTSRFTGDSVTVTAHGGSGGTLSNVTPTPGGTGSANSTHHDGGTGGIGYNGIGGGGGGGEAGGASAAGNGGADGVRNTGGAGGSGLADGGNGGAGGDSGGTSAANGHGGKTPGGGGGGGGQGSNGGFGGDGADGKAEIIYATTSLPSSNVLRFIMKVPAHGGNRGKVLVRAFTGGTVHQLDVLYQAGGKLELRGYSPTGTLLFGSGAQSANADGVTVMVSAELKTSGPNVAWAFKAIKPGATSLLASASGTVSAATIGNVSEVVVSPNGDITKTAIGHISVQYALIDLLRVSRALHGHHTEMGIDRFARLCGEIAMGAEPIFAEGTDHWGFETGTQGWTATSGAVAQSAVAVPGQAASGDLDPVAGYWAWPTRGSSSLLLTADGTGPPTARSPQGTSGQPVFPTDIVSAHADVYTPTALSGLRAYLNWYDNAGTFLSQDFGDTIALPAGGIGTVKVSKKAPSGVAYFSVQVQDNAADPAGTLIYIDHVRTHPRMGAQTRKELHRFLEEVEDLDQGILKDSKKLWGLGYRTRLSLVNQTPAVTLDFSKGDVSPPLEPVTDDQRTKNDITVKRHKGSSVRVTLDSGTLSVLEPPSGAGRYRKLLKVIAELDEQLLALATHLLNLGTVTDERYPTVTVDLRRAAFPQLHLASIMSAVAGVEIGDFVKIVSLPAAQYPSPTVKQLVLGYTEVIGARNWQITWNCAPESCYEITATTIRRW